MQVLLLDELTTFLDGEDQRGVLEAVRSCVGGPDQVHSTRGIMRHFCLPARLSVLIRFCSTGARPCFEILAQVTHRTCIFLMFMILLP